MTAPSTSIASPGVDTAAQSSIAAAGAMAPSSGMAIAQANRPDYQRPEYTVAVPDRALCRAFMVGRRAVQAAGTLYLPKWPEERDEHYKVRASIATVAKYYERTIQASVGMICATPPTLSADADPTIASDAEDIDGQGTHLEVFARQIATEAINGGFAAILVDAPPIPAGVALTLADEQALGLRPFWVAVTADQILSWIVDVPDWAALIRDYHDGRLTALQVQAYARQLVVRQVVIHEPTDTTHGAFGVQSVDRYRVLRLTDAGVTFELLEKRQNERGDVSFVTVAAGPMLAAKHTPFQEIPLALVYAGRKTAPFMAAPPLLGLAELNLDHYQVSADRRYLMRLCHAPTLFLAGIEPEDDGTGGKKPIRVGPNSVIAARDPNAKAGYVAAQPAALDSSQVEKEEIVRQMATLGMSFLGKDRRGEAETATGRTLDDAAENASHATVARGLQDGLEQALKFHAQYRGVAAPSITINTTYAAPDVDPQIAAVLWQAVMADKLDVESWIAYVKTGDLPDDVALRVQTLALVAHASQDDDTSASRQPLTPPDRALATSKPERPPAGASSNDTERPMRAPSDATA